MKFGIISDLHLEFRGWDFTPDPDIFYIIAGDIHSDVWERKAFLGRFEEDKVFWIKGNHDFYGDFLAPYVKDLRSKEVDGFKIAGATLWTKLDPLEYITCKNNLVDSRHIRDYTESLITNAHAIQKAFLLESGADIIVSHHGPSYQSVHPRYQGTFENCCFVSSLENEILGLEKPPKLWIHGHVHDQFDYMIGETRVVCHPRGYPREKPWYNTYEPLILEL